MSVVLTQAYLKGLNQGYNLEFRKSLDAQLARTDVLSTQLCEPVNAPGVASMEYDMAAGIPILKEVIGDEQEFQNLTTVRTSVDNKEFTRLLGLKRTALERNQAQIYLKDIRNAAVAFTLFKERRLAEELVNGFDSAKNTDYTGKAFFDTNKPLAKGKKGTFSNKGTKKLSAANFEAAVTSIRKRTDAEGNNLGLGSDLTLIVSPDYEATAQDIVALKTLSTGGENRNYNKARLKVFPYLDALNPHAWFLVDTSWLKPAVLQTEVPFASYMQTDPNGDRAITKGEFLYQLYWRGNIRLIEPLCVYGSTGADAA